MKQILQKTFAFISLYIALCLGSATHGQHYPEMITVEGGTFIMGDQHVIGSPDEFPLHKVTLDGFRIGKTEITVAQWQHYCERTGQAMPPEPSWGWLPDHPVVNILWEEAIGYCQWLSRETGERYRLPTEAEWEFAARGGNKSEGYKYSGGQWPDAVGWYASNSDRKTHPVAQKRPNELGIFDMTGNVWEWCSDWEGRRFDKVAQNNPLGPSEGRAKVIKGGAYAYVANINRISFRIALPPDVRRLQTGLRVVCE